jgi:hypothetical protein
MSPKSIQPALNSDVRFVPEAEISIGKPTLGSNLGIVKIANKRRHVVPLGSLREPSKLFQHIFATIERRLGSGPDLTGVSGDGVRDRSLALWSESSLNVIAARLQQSELFIN